MKLFEAGRAAEELRAIGFRVRVLRGYGRLRSGPVHTGFVARKAQAAGRFR